MNQEPLQNDLENGQDRQLARTLSMLIWASLGTYLFVIITGLYYSDWKLIAVMLAGSALLGVPLLLLRRGRLQAGSLVVTLLVLVTVTGIATVGQGIRDLAILAFPIVMIFAGLALDRTFFRLSVGMTLAAVVWLFLGELWGWYVPIPFAGEIANWFYLIGAIIILLIAALAVDLLATNMRKSLAQARSELAQRRQAENELIKQKNLLATIIESASEAIYAKDLGGKYIILNGSGARMLDHNVNAVIGRTDFDLLPVETAREFRKINEETVAGGRFFEREETVQIDGRTTVFLVHKTPWRDDSGNIIGVIGVSNDITGRKLAEEQLLYQGTHDALTALYNRAFFEAELARLERCREFPASIIMADVDRLKVVNDTLGHAAGDDLLRRIASLLGSVFREGDILARIGGDEFAVLLPMANAATAEQMLARVKDQLLKHNREHSDLPVHLSLGAAAAQKNNLTEAFRIADQNMYADKAARRSKANFEMESNRSNAEDRGS